jgi:LPXTG-motif cell wall-anchored protein
MTDAPIVITYSATINEEASMTEPEVNKAWFEMSKDPYNPGEVLGKSPESETKTYSTGLKLTKTDDEGKILTGAKFKIEGTSVKVTVINEEIYVEDPNGTFYQLKDSTYTEEAPVFEEEGYNADKYASTTIKYSKVINVTQTTAEQAVVAEGWVNADGIITFKGLGEGTYTITELVAPNGYNLLEEPITITIEFDYNKDTRVATWTVKRDGQELTADENGMFNFTVINKSGVVLPSTGGIGTTIFYVVGAALALCAVVLLVTRKRMSVEG